MSGGVDSSVVAKLMTEQDYDLSAIYMRNWDTRDESGTDNGCEWKKDWSDVQRVCKYLDIPVQMVDLSREYWTRVFEPSLAAWEAGATPNPDIWCNKEVKFGALMDKLATKDAWIATGHYAGKSWSSPAPQDGTSPRPKLLRPTDHNKDQTYYLSHIPEASLSRTLFPLAPYTKPEVREKAREWGLPTAERGESMGICFVGQKRRFSDFISQYISPKPGPIIHAINGKVLGTHNGLWTYTIGQNARIPGLVEKMFVSGKDSSKNKIYVVNGSNHPLLYKSRIFAQDWQWIWADSPPVALMLPGGLRARVQFRHRMVDVACTVRSGHEDGSIEIDFDEKQKAVAPGQVAAVYDGDWCLGCGMIMHAS
ncbi:tRNA-specific 2-thiouridylase [Irpex rosettiformis]|uniref:tRNA-specific 2-thiouridylase n=1 Tax=Irpex rosettiformis TaxID=378272 RepID=A0ACB8UHH7_9APHY|nr:tRNA-specific 2-thiouridylase [Irpex rosettiformis]